MTSFYILHVTDRNCGTRISDFTVQKSSRLVNRKFHLYQSYSMYVVFWMFCVNTILLSEFD